MVDGLPLQSFNAVIHDDPPSRCHCCGPDRPIRIAAPAGEPATTFEQGQGHAREGSVLQPAGSVLHVQDAFVPTVFTIGQPIRCQRITHQHGLIAGHALQQHRHGGVHVNAIGNQSKGDAAATAGLPHGAWSAVMESRHGIKRVGEHAHPLIKGCRGLLSGGCAVAQGDGDSEGVQMGDQVLCASLFRGERDQVDLCFKSRDPPVQFSKARWGKVRDRVSASALSRQKRTFQVRPQ